MLGSQLLLKTIWTRYWGDFDLFLMSHDAPQTPLHSHTQHHCWDCSLATPMITNIDTEVEHAHVHKDAVCGDGGGGGAPGCLYLSHTPSLVCVCVKCALCVYICMDMQARVEVVKCLCLCVCITDHAWCVQGPALFFLCGADRLPVFVRFSIKVRQVRQEQAGQKAEMSQFDFQHKIYFWWGA